MEVTTDDDEIRGLILRLARPHPSGGRTVERAAILAAGADSARVIAWITAHDGHPEAPAAAPGNGLHGTRITGGSNGAPTPVRYVLPAAAFG